MAPLADLLGIVGPSWRPSSRAWLHVADRFACRVDVADRIGIVTFNETFPSTMAIDGMAIGMTLDDLVASSHGFTTTPVWYALTERPNYVAHLANGDEIRARVDPDGVVRGIEITRPGLDYPDGADFQATVVPVDPFAYHDESDMLLEWAASHTFHDRVDFPAYARALMRGTPDDWHRAVPNWNWDDGIAPLLWIIRQRDCDKATALRAFYLSRPGEFLDCGGDRRLVPAGLVEVFDLIAEIRRRFLDGWYTRSSLCFDADEAFREEAGIPPSAPAAAIERDIPAAMRVSLPGRVLSNTHGESHWRLPKPSPRRVSRLRPRLMTAEERADLGRLRQADVERRKAMPTPR